MLRIGGRAYQMVEGSRQSQFGVGHTRKCRYPLGEGDRGADDQTDGRTATNGRRCTTDTPPRRWAFRHSTDRARAAPREGGGGPLWRAAIVGQPRVAICTIMLSTRMEVRDRLLAAAACCLLLRLASANSGGFVSLPQRGNPPRCGADPPPGRGVSCTGRSAAAKCPKTPGGGFVSQRDSSYI